MDFEFNFVSLLDFLAFVQGTLLGIVLMAKRKEHLSYFLLGAFLFAYSSELLIAVFWDTGYLGKNPQLLYLPISFFFLFMPMLFLYVESLSTGIDWKKRKWLLLPALVEFIVLCTFFLQSSESKIAQLESDFASVFYQIYVLIAMVYTIIYAFIVLKKVNRHRSQLDHFHSNVSGKQLNWIKWICIFIIAIDLVLLTQTLLPDAAGQLTYSIISALNVIFIFWAALSGFQQKAITIPQENLQEIITDKAEIPKVPDKSAEVEEMQRDFEKLQEMIQEKEIYKQTDLHLADLAHAMHFSQRKLSKLINEISGKNFKHYINGFRVEAAKKMLVDDNFSHLNMLGIADEVGFNSKTTFYYVFKQEVGATPQQYKSQQQ